MMLRGLYMHLIMVDEFKAISSFLFYLHHSSTFILTSFTHKAHFQFCHFTFNSNFKLYFISCSSPNLSTLSLFTCLFHFFFSLCLLFIFFHFPQPSSCLLHKMQKSVNGVVNSSYFSPSSLGYFNFLPLFPLVLFVLPKMCLDDSRLEQGLATYGPWTGFGQQRVPTWPTKVQSGTRELVSKSCSVLLISSAALPSTWILLLHCVYPRHRGVKYLTVGCLEGRGGKGQRLMIS